MNILILTGHFGLGHVRAAQAIKRAIERESSGVHVEIVDLFEHLSPKRSKKMYALFNFWTRYTPRLYNRLNAVSCHVNSLPLDKATFQKIDTLLIAHNTDMVISTLPFCTKCIGAYKQMTQKKLPLYTYITDVIAHEEWIAYGVDGYFVASGMTKKWIVSYGVKAEAVHVCGMPFIEVPSHRCAGEQKSSEPSERKKEILIMGGGLGLIPLDPPFFNELSQARDVHVTVIAGKNKKLKSKLEDGYPSFEVIGFTKETDRYVQRASLVVSKPGGITTFEAICSLTPIFALKPFLAQEVGNAEFIDAEHIGRVGRCGGVQLANEVLELVRNEVTLNQYSSSMMRLKEGWRAEQSRIARTLRNFISSRQESSCA